MKVLWVTNIKPGFVCQVDGTDKNPFGGWLDDMGHRLMSSDLESFVVLYPGKKNNIGSFGEMKTYEFVETENNDALFRDILKKHQPDLIHIWGTEYSHSCHLFDAGKALGMESRIIVSIQGLLSVYNNHWCGGLSDKVSSHRSLIDIVVGRPSIQGQRKTLKDRFESEKKLIRNCSNIIGRTRWDRACSNLINPRAKYFFCNESLRSSFYEKKWEYDKCEKHSILTGSWGNPIKGLHNIVNAIELLKDKYPDIKVYVCGRDPYNTEFYRLNSYERYIAKIIKQKNIKSVFCFTGLRNESEMCELFKKANVYVNSSAIENSANTIGEAMVVGTPCVVSDVGGAHDMVEDGKDGFIFPYNEYYMMAHYVDRIFSSRQLCDSMSESARIHARERHDRDKNYIRLMEIYNNVLESIN